MKSKFVVEQVWELNQAMLEDELMLGDYQLEDLLSGMTVEAECFDDIPNQDRSLYWTIYSKWPKLKRKYWDITPTVGAPSIIKSSFNKRMPKGRVCVQLGHIVDVQGRIVPNPWSS